MASDGHSQAGEQVAALRKARGWTQSHLAEVAACSLRSVQRAEQGRCRSETLLCVAAALDADLSELLPSTRPSTEVIASEGVLSTVRRSVLPRISSGKELLDLVTRTIVCQFDHEPVVGEDAEAVADLFQAVQGYAAILPDLLASERVRASALLHGRIEDLAKRGLHVLGGVERRPLLLKADRPIQRPVAVIAVRRERRHNKRRAS